MRIRQTGAIHWWNRGTGGHPLLRRLERGAPLALPLRSLLTRRTGQVIAGESCRIYARWRCAPRASGAQAVAASGTSSVARAMAVAAAGRLSEAGDLEASAIVAVA